jgi:hypothetical protein
VKIPRDSELAILAVRRRLEVHAAPATWQSLIGPTAIRAKLKPLSVYPRPFGRTIERVLQEMA